MKMFVFFAPNVLSSFYVLLFFSFLLFALDTSSLCCLIHQPITWIYGLNPNDVLLPCPILVCLSFLFTFLCYDYYFLHPPPSLYVHFDDFIAPNVFRIMSAVSYCYSLTERHNHKEKPRDPLTGYFQKLYVDYLVLGSIFIQSIFDFQTKTEEVDFLGIYSRVSRPLEVNRFFLHLYIFLLVSHSLAVWVERLLH